MMGSRMAARRGVRTCRRRLSPVAALLVAIAAVAIAGCGDSDSGDEAASGANTAAASGDAQKTLDQGFAGIVDEPPSSGPKAVPGKTVWMLSCLGFEGCQRSTNGFIDAAKERVTTFAIDVDRASYANVRRFLTAGLVPPPQAVRVEEMINYFDYRYPQPSGDAPFSFTTEVAV